MGKTKGDSEADWVCKLCTKVFKGDGAEILECEYCEEHFCKACLKLTKAEYHLFSKRSDLHWYCPPCEAKTIKNLKVDKEVGDRCKEYFEKLEKRIDNIESKLDEKPDKTEIKEMIKGGLKEIDAKNIDSIREELRDSEARKNNVVIYSLQESSATKWEQRLEDDEKLITEMFHKMELSTASILRVNRLGKRAEGDSTEEAEGAGEEEEDGEKEEAKPRPIKLEFIDGGGKARFMRNLKKLGGAGETFVKISVVHDMSPQDREENRKKVTEAKELNEKEKSKNHKHVVVGPTWDRRVVRVKKKRV